MSRREFELTEQQHAKLLDACKPVPAMYLSGGQPMFRSQQENANDAWAALGSEIGFDGASVQPVTGKTSRFFTAEIVEPPVKSPALAAIAKSEACGKRGPRTGALCRRFKGHEQPPSPQLGADFHEAGDSQGVIERWAVSAEEITAKEQRIIGGLAELDQVRELLKAAGFVPIANFAQQGAPGSGVHYIELRPWGEKVTGCPLILRTQFLFNKPHSWALMTVANAGPYGAVDNPAELVRWLALIAKLEAKP